MDAHNGGLEAQMGPVGFIDQWSDSNHFEGELDPDSDTVPH